MFTAAHSHLPASSASSSAISSRHAFPPSLGGARRDARCPYAGVVAELDNGPAVRSYCSGDEALHDAELHAVDQELRAQVLADSFPCVAARSAFNRQGYRFGLLAPLASAQATAQLHAGLTAFSAEFDEDSPQLVTYLAVFEGDAGCDEQAFERQLWAQLQALHEFDAQRHGWADAVDADPASDSFSFSVGGRAFFIVGMHPRASRLSRQAPRVTLVFNFHAQFEALRAKGKYEVMKTAIRKRDVALQGSINPVLARFGESSEARQYSGRAVAADWQCPFHPVHGANA